MSDAPTPQTDAERIRLKRLAKLAGSSTSSATPSSSTGQGTPAASISTASPAPLSSASSKPSTPTTAPISQSAALKSTHVSKLASQASQSAPVSPAARLVARGNDTLRAAQTTNVTPRKVASQPFVWDKWEEDTVESVFGVALDKEVAKKGSFVWLKGLGEEILSETPDAPQPLRGKFDTADRLLIGRLELDPNSMSDDSLTNPPSDQTSFEYLVLCWKRLNSQRSVLLRKGLQSKELERASGALEKLRDLVVSYAGLTLQDATMFPQPSNGKPLGPLELLPSLYAIASASSVYSSSVNADPAVLLTSSEVEPFLTDIAKRFDKDGLEEVLGGVVRAVAFSPGLAGGMVHSSVTLPPGLSLTSWRQSVAALECLFSVRQIAIMITGMPEWNPSVYDEATGTGVRNGNEHEKSSILGFVMRLGIFARDWPAVLNGFYKDFDNMTPREREASDAALKSALISLRTSLFDIVNHIVRAGAEPRSAFLSYVARVVQLNRKRAAMRYKYETQASDSFIANLHYCLLLLAEPFMDAGYKQLEKIDLWYYVKSDRIDIKEETRINATPPEIEQWEKEFHGDDKINFVSEIFYLLAGVNRLSTGAVVNYLNALARHVRDMKKQLEIMEKDESWRGQPVQAQVEAALKRGKEQMSQIHANMETMYVALLQEDFASRCLQFASFVSVWLLRMVDPTKRHPGATLRLPLPEEVPLVFKVQPEYTFDDVVDYWDFAIKYKPSLFELSGQKELIDFAMAFLTSTWYITNPYLKSKIVGVLAIGVRPFRRYNQGILGNALCTHPLSLKWLMMCLMSFYVECEKTGTHTQFYDKFQIRRDIAEVMQSVWRDPTHRAVMENFTSNMDEFIKFANRLMNDVTFMLDELLTKLAEIKKLQLEMDNKEEWDALPQEQREDRQNRLRAAEGIAEPWVIYSKEFLALLIEFTNSTKAPFVSPEIVGRLAAMLNYVLEQLAGDRCSDLKSKDMDKYGFDPKEMLSKVLQIYLNLSGEFAFVQAIAGEGRSYRKSLFDRALKIATEKVLKSTEELEVFKAFAIKVEEVRLAMDEEEIDDYPEEFEDPVMATIMKDPVILPSSKVTVDMSTIKSHLLSDPTDPFNRVPLKIEDVVPNVELKQRIEAFIAERRAKAGTEKLASINESQKAKVNGEEAEDYDI